MKLRKLYQPITSNNQSLVCPDVCDSDCPYGCYPYDDTYALPPPPIPQSLPPPPSPPPPQLTNHNISPYVIIASTFFGITLLLIIYYIIFIKNCFISSSNDQHDSDSDSSNDIQLPTIDHPIWYIRTVGLQPSIINSITVFNFKKGESLIEGLDCSVCLNEFQEGELLRLLPKCNHAFHIPCIDTWLRSHTTCPVCRAGILVSAPPDFPPTARNPVIEITERPEAEVANNSEIRENVEIQTESSPCLEIQDSAANREKLVKRCVSADSFPMSMIKLEMVNLQVNGENEESPFNQRRDICSTSRIHQINNDDAAEQPFSNRDVSVRRSFSYGGRSFLSRHPQNSNLVLPL